MLSSSLSQSFVRATLVALDLPRHLADRYAAPESQRAPPDQEQHRYPPLPTTPRFDTPSRPFPDR